MTTTATEEGNKMQLKAQIKLAVKFLVVVVELMFQRPQIKFDAEQLTNLNLN